MYEHRDHPPISARSFRARLVRHALFALLILLLSIAVGTVGHVYYEGMPWHKALLNTCFLLSGFGLAVFPESMSGQLFAGLFALYAGFVFIAISGIVIAPILHRFLHKFHWGGKDDLSS
jgi:membrane protein YdbS with pleckstrin-like domain